MRFIAEFNGFYKGVRRRKGEMFDAPEGFKASWAKPVQSPASSIPVESDEPCSLGQIARQQAIEDEERAAKRGRPKKNRVVDQEVI